MAKKLLKRMDSILFFEIIIIIFYFCIEKFGYLRKIYYLCIRNKTYKNL